MKGIFTVAASAAALALAMGCGAEDFSPETIAEAAGATAKAGGSRMHVEVDMSAAGESFTMAGDGVMDAAGRNAAITWDLSGIPGGKGEMRQIVDGWVMYMSVPDIGKPLPDGKSWIKIDMREATRELGFDISQFGSTGADASQTLDQLRATGDVEKEGSEEVRGEKTTHYRAVVNLREYPDLVPEDERAQAKASVDRMIAMTGESKIPAEVWIDDDDLVRRMRQQLEMEVEGQEMEMDITFELFDFGTRVAADPPPAGEVLDVTDLAAEQARRQQQSGQQTAP